MSKLLDSIIARMPTVKNASDCDSDRLQLALSQIAGKRLTFAEVTGKMGQAPF